MNNQSTDETALAEIGLRLARFRLNRNLTQSQLAEEAGVSLSTVNRLEAGNSSQLTNLIRILRALELLDQLDKLVPIEVQSPIQQLKLEGKSRRRASRKRGTSAKSEWSWEDAPMTLEQDKP